MSAAADVTRRLPAAHTWLGWLLFRDRNFQKAAQDFLVVLYDIDVATLSDTDLEATERHTRVAINVIETHMLLRYGPADAAECRVYSELIAKLRDALSALDAGLPTNPAKRPTREQMLRSLALSLRESGAVG